MRILHVNSARSFRGGERQTALLALAQHRLGFDTRIAVYPGSKIEETMLAEGFPRERLHSIRMRGEFDLVAAFRLRRLCRRFRISILHLHTAHAHALGVLAGLLGAGAKTIVSRRVDYQMAGNPLSRLKYRLADGYIAISSAVQSILVADGIPGERVAVVHSGVPIPEEAEWKERRSRREETRRSLAIPDGGRAVLNVGALVGHKGQEILARAARILAPKDRILIAGEGPLREEILAAIRRDEVEGKVILLGRRDDVADLYAACDAYVQPSVNEGLGTAMIDAMAWRLPVAATAAGGIPEAVRDGETGILVRSRNPFLLGEALKRILDDGELASRLVAAAYRLVVSEFSEEAMVQGTTAAYRFFLSDGARGDSSLPIR